MTIVIEAELVRISSELQTDVCGIVQAGSIGVLTHRDGETDDLVSVRFDRCECWVPRYLLKSLTQSE
jgi:hypothetical protein